MTGDNESADEKPTIVHLTADDIRILVTYIEIADNFTALFGSSKKTKVGGKPLMSKIQAFEKMAQHLNRNTKTPNLPKLCGRNMQQRWGTFMRKFNRVLKKSKSTGAGLTPAEAAAGLSLQAKWEKKCPQFSRMCALFGGRANVKPSATMELGIPAASTLLDPPAVPASPVVVNVDGDSEVSDYGDSDMEEGQYGGLGIDVDTLAEGLGEDDALEADGELQGKSIYEKIDEFVEEVEMESTALARWKQRGNDEVEQLGDRELDDEEMQHGGQEQRVEEEQRNDYNCDGVEKPRSKASSSSAGSQSKQHPKTNSKHQKKKKASGVGSGKRTGNNLQTPTKPKKQKQTETAQEARLSIAQSYTRNTGVKLDYLQEKLKDERAARRETRDDALRQRVFEAEQNRLEREDRQAARKQTLLLELLAKDKTPDEIARYMAFF